MGEEVGVGGRVRPRGAPDRAWSISMTLSKTSIPSTPSWSPGFVASVEPVRERLVEDLVHERGLSGAGDTRDGDEPPDRKSTSIPFLRASTPREREPAASVVLAPRRHEDPSLAAEELARHRAGRRRDDVEGPFADDLASVLPRTRTEIDDPVRGAHHLFVVLDDEHRVADVAELLERVDEPAVVALVEPDRRLVEDVEDADELRSDLRRQPEPLRLATGQRLRGLGRAGGTRPRRCRGRSAALAPPSGCAADQLLGLRQLELVDEAKGCVTDIRVNW